MYGRPSVVARANSSCRGGPPWSPLAAQLKCSSMRAATERRPYALILSCYKRGPFAQLSPLYDGQPRARRRAFNVGFKRCEDAGEYHHP